MEPQGGARSSARKDLLATRRFHAVPYVMVKWRGERRSSNVEDRRGRRTRRRTRGQAGGRARGRVGAPVRLTGGIGVIIVLAVIILGGDPTALLQMSESGPIESSSSPLTPARDDSAAQFISTMLASTEDVWAEIFENAGWAYHANRTRRILEPGDVEEGLAAAEAIGDDRLQRNAGRRVSPESFTHGTSAQRRTWLERGLQSGNPDECDTFDR